MSLLHIAGGATEDKLYPEDVFVSYLRTGTGADVTVTTGIDYTKGFMTWTKGRNDAADHTIYDSARGVTKDLVSNSTAAETTQTTGLKAVSTTGHTIGLLAKMNTSGATYVDWVFRKAPKFFDVQTKVHTSGVASTVDLSSLGEVGMVVVKAASVTSNWYTWHRSLAVGNIIKLNATGAQSTTSAYLSVNGTTLTIASTTPSATYVIYAWAHDPSADGIIQCGSFVDNITVTIGWEPQYIIIKRTDSTGDWITIDSMRGCSVGGIDSMLNPNLSNAEDLTTDYIDFTPTGFISKTLTGTYIYMVIRRPMKVPTSGTEVFQPVVYTGTNADNRLVNTTIAPDMVMVRERDDTTPLGMAVASRLTGNARLQTQSTTSEINDSDSFMTPTFGYGNSFSAMNGFGVGNDSTCKVNFDTTIANNHIALAFKRAKGFFDVVCYAGTGAQRTVNHNLGVVPELMIVKGRSTTGHNWIVYHSSLGATISGVFAVDIPIATAAWGNTEPTDTVFTTGTYNWTNASSSTYVAYLFATLAGISKVGSYTGNGSSQTINCGFSAGARFVLCKRTDSTGNWYIWDTARGIVADNDPHLSLNTTAAEVTTYDSVDPEASGFIVNQNTATNINVNGGSYIFLAIA